MNATEYKNQLATNPHPVVVDFWAPWCVPCRTIEPALKDLEKRYEGQVDLMRIQADQNRDLLVSLGVFSIPTLIVYQNGAEVTRRSGSAEQAALEGLFKAALTGKKPTPGPTSTDRLVRLSSGIGLFSLGLVNLMSLGGPGWISGGLVALGLGLGFSAVYDRCPVYRAVSGWVKSMLQNFNGGTRTPPPA